MIEQGYYSKRIDELEDSKREWVGKLATAKLSIKSIDNEIAKAKEAMSGCTKSIDIQKDNKDKKILELENEVEKFKKIRDKYIDRNVGLVSENTKLKEELDKLKEENMRLKLFSSDDIHEGVILSDDFGKENIFKELMGVNEDG